MPASTPGRGLGGGGGRVPGRHDRAPGGQRSHHVEGAGQLGGQRHQRHAAGGGPALGLHERRVREGQVLGPVGAPPLGRQERPLQVEAERGGAACAVDPRRRPGPQGGQALGPDLGGPVTMVGSQAVTPHRGSSAATSHRRPGSADRSMPPAPLHCRSTRPGATSRPAASIVAAPAGGLWPAGRRGAPRRPAGPGPQRTYRPRNARPRLRPCHARYARPARPACCLCQRRRRRSRCGRRRSSRRRSRNGRGPAPYRR